MSTSAARMGKGSFGWSRSCNLHGTIAFPGYRFGKWRRLSRSMRMSSKPHGVLTSQVERVEPRTVATGSRSGVVPVV